MQLNIRLLLHIIELLTIFFVAGKQVVISFEVGAAVKLIGCFADEHLFNVVNSIHNHCWLISQLQTDYRSVSFTQCTKRLIW